MNKETKLQNKVSRKSGTTDRKMAVKSDKDSASFIPLEKSEKPFRDSKNGKRSLPRKSRAHKKPRLIVRNLPYKATEDSVRKHFAPFGEITDVVLLRKPNKQLVGCGFVQFSKAQSAAKAIAHASGKQFMGRPIVVDWAVPKDQYLQKTDSSGSNNIKVKVEKKEDDSSTDISDSGKNEVKLNHSVKFDDDSGDEDNSDDEGNNGDEDNSDDEDHKADVKYRDDEDDDDDDEDDDDDDDDDDEYSDQKGKKIAASKNWDQDKKPRYESNDVTEGRTVFLRNLPFSVNNDKLRDFGEQFGPVAYAVVCMDPKSDHSRGTGFIKFEDAEDSKDCIAQSQRKELVLDNRTIDVTSAISRDDAKKSMTKEKVQKDNRNLYLLKEGLITANCTAAEGISPSDMEKRIHLERWKTKTLRDLTMFVSRVRLVVHNLPPAFSDAQLRALFIKHGGFKPRITEARIMRDLKNVDANGVGRSKEYGFVTFTNHENALEGLRNVNNNPSIFGPNKRPIVSFSIEDKKMLNIRKRRQERSLMKNPTWKHYKKEEKDEPNSKNVTKNDKRAFGKTPAGGKTQVGNKRKNSAAPSGPAPKVARPFMGSLAKQGEGGTIPLRKLNDQSKLVRQNAKEKKKQAKQKKRPERIKQEKLPQAKKKEEGQDDFANLVNKYKASLSGAQAARSKWYE